MPSITGRPGRTFKKHSSEVHIHCRIISGLMITMRAMEMVLGVLQLLFGILLFGVFLGVPFIYFLLHGKMEYSNLLVYVVALIAWSWIPIGAILVDWVIGSIYCGLNGVDPADYEMFGLVGFCTKPGASHMALYAWPMIMSILWLPITIIPSSKLK